MPSAYLGLSAMEMIELLNNEATRAALSPALVCILRSALVTGFRVLFDALAGLAAVNLLLQLPMQEFSLNKDHETNQVLRPD